MSDTIETVNQGSFKPKKRITGVRVCAENREEIRSYEDCKIIAYKGKIQNVEIKKWRGYEYASPGDWILEGDDGNHYRATEEKLKESYTLA
jgi:endo-1,4-beta-mannosidase